MKSFQVIVVASSFLLFTFGCGDGAANAKNDGGSIPLCEPGGSEVDCARPTDGGGVCCPVTEIGAPMCNPRDFFQGGWRATAEECMGRTTWWDGLPAVTQTDEHGCRVVVDYRDGSGRQCGGVLLPRDAGTDGNSSPDASGDGG